MSFKDSFFEEEKKKWEERDIIILEDEIQGLQLKLSASETQLDEQVRLFY